MLTAALAAPVAVARPISCVPAEGASSCVKALTCDSRSINGGRISDDVVSNGCNSVRNFASCCSRHSNLCITAVPAPPTTIPRISPLSPVAVIMALFVVVYLARVLTVVPVTVSFGTSRTTADAVLVERGVVPSNWSNAPDVSWTPLDVPLAVTRRGIAAEVPTVWKSISGPVPAFAVVSMTDHAELGVFVL
jgi:hypothetical protein